MPTRQNQNLITESGFATKQEATDAEAVRRAEELVRQAATGGVAAPMPTTLAMLLAEFMKQHAQENLAPKTAERYREMADYIVRTTADIYSHAIRGKDHAAAQCWDDIMQRSRGEKSKGVN